MVRMISPGAVPKAARWALEGPNGMLSETGISEIDRPAA